MRRQADLSYQTIATACQQLVEQGEKLSIRKIAQQTGGSYSTIATFFHRWQDEQALAKKVGASLSETFQQAALAEINRANLALETRLNEQLNTEQARYKESHNLLIEHEVEIHRLKEQLASQQETAAQQQLELERALIAAETLAKASAERESSCMQLVETLRQQAHQAELQKAIAETHAGDLEKHYRRLEQEVLQLTKAT